MRHDRYTRLGTDLADVCYQAIRVKIERHAHRVGRLLVELCAFHVFALPRIGWHEMRLFECEVAHCLPFRFGGPFRCGGGQLNRDVVVTGAERPPGVGDLMC